MLAGAFSGALWTLLGSLVVFVGILVYATLIRQISARSVTIEQRPRELRTFGWPEGLLPALLVSILLWGIMTSIGRSALSLDTPERVENLLLGTFLAAVGSVLFITAILVVRGITID